MAKLVEISRAGSMTSEEQELAAIACGKRSKEDQALWDKVAIAAMQSLMPIYWDTIGDYNSAEEMKVCHMESAFDYADAFMAERAKRMKGGV